MGVALEEGVAPGWRARPRGAARTARARAARPPQAPGEESGEGVRNFQSVEGFMIPVAAPPEDRLHKAMGTFYSTCLHRGTRFLNGHIRLLFQLT